MNSLSIVHEPEKHRFTAPTPNGEAILSYGETGEKTLNFYHTFVPPADRGQGMAGKVVEYALEYASKNGYRVVPGCAFVRSWLEKNPQFKHLTA